jgi:hypothetical protein
MNVNEFPPSMLSLTHENSSLKERESEGKLGQKLFIDGAFALSHA